MQVGIETASNMRKIFHDLQGAKIPHEHSDVARSQTVTDAYTMHKDENGCTPHTRSREETESTIDHSFIWSVPGRLVIEVREILVVAQATIG